MIEEVQEKVVQQATNQTVQETVEEVQEVKEVAASFTFDGEMETFNGTTVKLYLSELYGVPLSWIFLNTTAGSIVVKMVIRPPIDASANVIAAVLQNVTSSSSSSVEGALSEAIGVNVSQTAAPGAPQTRED